MQGMNEPCMMKQREAYELLSCVEVFSSLHEHTYLPFQFKIICPNSLVTCSMYLLTQFNCYKEKDFRMLM